MTTPREELAARIRTDNPTYLVDSYPKEPKQVAPGKPFVDVFATSIQPISDDLNLQHDLEVHAYASKTSGESAEAEAEDIRDQVLLSIQRLTGYAWTRAERVTLAESFIGYKITVTAGSKNVYAQTIRAEG